MRLELRNDNNKLGIDDVYLCDADSGEIIKGVKRIELSFDTEKWMPTLKFAVHTTGEFEHFYETSQTSKDPKFGNALIESMSVDNNEVVYSSTDFDLDLNALRPYRKNRANTNIEIKFEPDICTGFVKEMEKQMPDFQKVVDKAVEKAKNSVKEQLKDCNIKI